MTSCLLSPNSKAFTLFEVLIALAVFCIAVTGLAVALETAVQSSIEARQRVLSRLELESRLAYNMVDPPLSGNRTIEARDNNGIAVEESATPEQLEDAQNHLITGLYRIKIITKNGKINDTAEMLLYHP
ncbi:MAG: prepilin-type N-terminal cleavage/methylation domain-containing protein [Chthoniobacterales bacterium]